MRRSAAVETSETSAVETTAAAEAGRGRGGKGG